MINDQLHHAPLPHPVIGLDEHGAIIHVH
jgi:hypothetical protein